MTKTMSEEKKEIRIEDGNEEIEARDAYNAAFEAPAEEESAPADSDAKAEPESDEGSDDVADESEEKDADLPEAETEKADEKEDGSSHEEAESERYMRLMAEFQNFKRRAAKEKSDIHAFANERIINDLLPVLDNFERALGMDTEASGMEASKMSKELSNYAKGMELIFTQLKTALENAGLKEIKAMGEDFDPALHNAVMTESIDEYEDGKITKVMQKGYTLNNRLIRPSMVAVNKK